MKAPRRSPPGPIGNGSEGCDSTGATTAGSVIMASAKPPVKHMPTAPTPKPPQSAWALRARARSQSTIVPVGAPQLVKQYGMIERGADLSRADLSHADLSRADLSGTDLSDADLSGAIIKLGNQRVLLP